MAMLAEGRAKRGVAAEAVRGFVDVCVRQVPGARVSVSAMYDAYVATATSYGTRVLPQHNVEQIWAQAGLVPAIAFGVRVYEGWAVLFDPLSTPSTNQSRVLMLPRGLGPEDVVALHRLAVERARQIGGEGHTAGLDDGYEPGVLAAAGAAYALSALAQGLRGWRRWTVARCARWCWPWARGWWKPKGAGRDLDRAGALLVAELARAVRAGEV